MRVAPEKWKWYGNAAHLIVGNDCRFHMATLVGKHIVSTVGEWLPDSTSWDIYARSKDITLAGRGDERRYDFLKRVGYVEIGCERKYETMVFKAGVPCKSKTCGCGLPTIDGSELDFGGYNDAGAATRGHMALCRKWGRR